MIFTFDLRDCEAKEFCESIVKEMSSLLSISEGEALERVNCHWSHLDIIGGDHELIFHEEPRFWAKDIYYGSDSYWWLSDNQRNEKGLPPLKAKVLNSA